MTEVLMDSPDDERLKEAGAADQDNHSSLLWGMFWGGLVVATLPMAAIYFSRMWRLPHYQYFPFALAFVAYLAWSRSDRRFYSPMGWIAVASLVFGAVATAGAWSLKSPWMATIGCVFFASGCLSRLRGKQDASLVALSLPLLLLIRLPVGYDQLLILKLQQVTTKLTSLILDVVGVPHGASGNVIQLVGRELFVAEACSGIQSVFTLAFLSTVMIVAFRRRLWLAPFYLAIALLLAVAGNVVRVSTVAAVYHWAEWDWASGWPHDCLGYVTLLAAGLLLVSFDRLIVAVLHPTSMLAGPAKHNPIVRLWNWCVNDGSLVELAEEYYLGRNTGVTGQPSNRLMSPSKSTPRWAFYLVGCLAVVLTGMTFQQATLVPEMRFDGGEGMFADGLIWEPDSLAVKRISDQFALRDHQVVRGGDNPELGENADYWCYSRDNWLGGSTEGQFVISQTYRSWHELCLCYELNDWQLLNRSSKSRESSTQNLPYAFAVFSTDDDYGRGYLWYAGIDAEGAVVDPPPRPGRLRGRFDDPTKSTGKVMMVQLWIATPNSLESGATKRIASDFANMVNAIANEVMAETASHVTTEETP